MGSAAVAVAPRKSPSSGRRTNKPLVEKKRRARINGCLGQLKSLILSAMQTDQGAQVSRLEKADILEMTVKYLRHVQKQQVSSAGLGSEPEVAAKFSAGYTECATEVIRYIDQAKCVPSDIRSRLESHLVERLRDAVCPPAASASASGMPISGSGCNGGATSQQQQQQQLQEVAVKKETAPDVCSKSITTPSSIFNLGQNVPMVTANLERIRVRTLTTDDSTPANLERIRVRTLTTDDSTPANLERMRVRTLTTDDSTPANPLVSSGSTAGVTVSSASTTAEYARHYQTAVDLANMAAGVTLPSQTPSCTGTTTTSSSPTTATRPRLNPDPARCKSISPAQENKDRGKPRKRYNSTESALPQPQPLSNSNNIINFNNNNYNKHNIGSNTNSAFTNKSVVDASERLQPGAVNSHGQSSTTVYSEKNSYHSNESYLRSFQHPLHIDIPESSDSNLNTNITQKTYFRPGNVTRDIPTPTASPSSSNAMQVPPSSPSSASLSSSSSATTTIYNYVEEAPPTLLYAYNYNLPHRPNNSNRQATNSPRLNYSLIVCQPEGEISATSTTDSALSTHGEIFHATFNLEQRQCSNAPGRSNFYCAPKPGASQNCHSQGQGERTMRHPAALNAPSTTGIYPPPTSSMPQAQEFGREERRLDVNNNSSFYDSHQLQCPTFLVSQPGDRSLRKDSACVQIPSSFYSHTNIPIPDNRSSTAQPAPAELSSNHRGAQFHGNPRSCTSTHLTAPRWCNQSPSGDQAMCSSSSSSSNKQAPPPHCVNPYNNGLGSGRQQHAANTGQFYSLNGQQSGTSDSVPLAPPPPPQPPTHTCRDNTVLSGVTVTSAAAAAASLPPHPSSSTFTPSPSPPQHDTSRPALKKHLLFGQRSEVTRRQGYKDNNSAPGADDSTQTQPQAQASGTLETGQRQTCSMSSLTLSRRHPTPSYPDDYHPYHYQSYHQQQSQETKRMTRGEEYELAAPGNGAHAVSSSAKRPCLQSGVMTSCYRTDHVTDEPMVWRPW